MNWQPSLGAWPGMGGTHFRVWAPEAQTVELLLHSRSAGASTFPLLKAEDGTFGGCLASAQPGDRYGYRIDGRGPFPDPVSRFQPEGVHGASQIVDPRSYVWSDQNWRGIPLEELVLYELHVGTFTPAGTFAGACEYLPRLKELGVNAIELLPVADFAGNRGWGYDGVDLFAPARCYGSPDDLRRLVDVAHQMGLAVFLDVVYNHLGPEGNYLAQFSPHYFRHNTPWGPGLNLDGEYSAPVRQFFIENAQCWFHEYHIDGLRFDATHALRDASPRPLLAELCAAVRESTPARHVHFIAEDYRNLNEMLWPEAAGGWGLDAVWTDDFHHELRRLLTGDCEGVYQDFRGTMTGLVKTINDGWLFQGEFSKYRNRQRGTDPTGLPRSRFVYYLQNHDRIGDRALGDRLNQVLEPAAYRAASMLLLSTPAVPLLFMGQEWAASTPFLFFTDFDDELAAKVRAGRLHDFRFYAAFSDPAIRARVPDVNDPEAFRASRLQWIERDREPHASTWRLYQELLRLRREEPALLPRPENHFAARELSPDALLIERHSPEGAALLIVVQLRGPGTVELAGELLPRLPEGECWRPLLTTEDPRFTPDAVPLPIEIHDDRIRIDFARPAGVILRGEPIL